MKPEIVAAVFLALHLLPLFWRPNPMWGTDFLFYMTGPWFVFFSLSAVLLFVTGFRRKLQAIVCHFPFALWKGGSRVWVARTAILLLALAALVTMPSARHFLGDGYILIGKLETDTWPNVVRAPFSYTVIRTLHDVGAVLWTSAENTYRTYSTVSGVIYVLLTFPVAAALGKTRLEKSIVLAFLLTAGYLQLFFGYVEHYALCIPFLLLYILLGIRVQEQRLPLHVPATVMGLLLAFHQAFAVFGPSLLYLAYHVYNRRREMVKTWKNVAFPVTALCCVPLTTALLLALSGVDFESYISRMGGRNFLPVFAEPGMAAQYRMFSTSHILDFLNQQLLVAPAAFMAVFLLRKNALGRQPFLAICAFVPLLFTFLANPEIGAFRDWDVMALPALPLTLWAASALLQGMRHREDLFRGAFMICGAGALHGVLWIGLNANAGSAEDRFVDQLDRLKGGASGNGWLTMGRFHGQQGNRAAAHEAFRRSIEADPTNPNRWLTAGNFSRKTGQYTSAIGYFNKAVELNPDDAMPYMNLGAVYGRIGQYKTGIRNLKRALELQPDNPETYRNLGLIYKAQIRYPDAIEHFEKALELQTGRGDLQSHLNLGDTYYDMGQHEKAIPHYQTAIQLNPNHANAHLLLGLSYRALKYGDQATAHFEKTLELEPNHPQAALIRRWLEQIRARDFL